MKKWITLSTEIVFKNPWWTYRKNAFSYDEGKEGVYHIVETFGSSLIIPRLPDGTFLMVKQYRYLWDRESVEFPCGGVKEGLSHLETAKLELGEETGFKANSFTPIGSFNPYNGVTSEVCEVFLAEQFSPSDAQPDDMEEISVLTVSADEINAFIRSGDLWDGMSMAAWTLYTNHQK